MGCSSADEEQAEAVSVPVEVSGFVTPYQEAERGRQGAPATRAWLPPDGFSTIDEASSQVIGICFTQDSQEPMMGHFFKSSGNWRTSVEIESAGNYFLYGYTPHITGITCAITDWEGTNSKYSEGAVLTLRNLPTVTSQDYCVVVGAKNGGVDYEPDENYSVSGLVRGDFEYAAKANKGVGAGGNYVFLLFDHLYAALRVRMKVGYTYHSLRTIKLKELKLKARSSEYDTKAKTSVAVTLKKTDGGTDPVESVVFTPTGAAMDYGTVYENAEGMALSTAYSSYMSYFMPQNVDTLILQSKYDVYDKADTPNLVRKDCTATNTIVISDIFSRQEFTERGKRYTINMTIEPTYLYVMSEPDLDSPTMVAN